MRFAYFLGPLGFIVVTKKATRMDNNVEIPLEKPQLLLCTESLYTNFQWYKPPVNECMAKSWLQIVSILSKYDIIPASNGTGH